MIGGAELQWRIHGGFGHGGEWARGRAREGEIDPYGSGGWRGTTEGSGRFGEAGGGSRVDARGEHAPSSSWHGRKTTGRRPVGWAGQVAAQVRPGKFSLSLALLILVFYFSATLWLF